MAGKNNTEAGMHDDIIALARRLSSLERRVSFLESEDSWHSPYNAQDDDQEMAELRSERNQLRAVFEILRQRVEELEGTAPWIHEGQDTRLGDVLTRWSTVIATAHKECELFLDEPRDLCIAQLDAEVRRLRAGRVRS